MDGGWLVGGWSVLIDGAFVLDIFSTANNTMMSIARD